MPDFLQGMLNAAAPTEGDGYMSTGKAVFPRGVWPIWEPLVIPGGVEVEADGRVELKAMLEMPALLTAQADPNPNYYGAYMGGIRGLILNGNHRAQVGLQAGLVVAYTFEKLRCINCLDAGMDLSQTQNSLLQACVFEHNGEGGGELACGLRFSDAAATNRVIACNVGQNWKSQVVFCDSRQRTADGGTSPLDDQPAGRGGPSQNTLQLCIIEEYGGRSQNLLYARAGGANVLDANFFSHIRHPGYSGPVNLLRFTSEDAPQPLPTANWTIRDNYYRGSGEGYTGIHARGTWDMLLRTRRANWGGVAVENLVDKDHIRAVEEVWQ